MREFSPSGDQHRSARWVPWMAGALAVAAADGCQAAWAGGDAGTVQRIALWAVASGTALLPALVLAVLCAFTLNLAPVKDVLNRFGKALGMERGEGRGAATVALLFLLGSTLIRLSIVGRTMSERMSAHLAATATVLATLLALLACVLLTTILAPWIRRFPALLGRAWSPLGAPAVRRVAFVVAACAALATSLDTLLPTGYATTAIAGACALTVFQGSLASLRIGRALTGARGVVAGCATLAACAASPWMFGRLLPEAKLAIFDHAPLASVILLVTRSDSRIAGASSCQGPTCEQPGEVASLAGEDGEPPTRVSHDRRPNVLLIHFDALRPDHLGFAGYARPTSPTLDRFRASAVWFQTAYTPAPGTRFAMASVFTGMDLDRIPQSRGPGYDFQLLPAAVTLAEDLRAEGYDRVGFTIGPVLERVHGIGQGFRVWETPWTAALSSDLTGQAAKLTTDAAIAYLASRAADQPYLLFTHYQCTHAPYVKHSEWDFGDDDIDRYDSALAYCDREIGRLLAEVDARSDAGRTAVVLYSDHGELFGEHGFREHGNSLFEPDVRVLLLVRPPASFRRAGAPSTVSTPVSLIDLAPTVLHLAGVEHGAVPEGGTSLVPLLEGPADATLARAPSSSMRI